MKKLVIVFLLLMCVSMPMTPNGQEVTPRLADRSAGKGTIENPEEYWKINGYPDNISFACEEGHERFGDGTITKLIIVGIVNADENNKQSVIDLLSPNCRITFINCTQSYKQREVILNKILNMEDKEIFNVTLIRNNEEIHVLVSKNNVGHYTESLKAQFGDIIWVTDESAIGYHEPFDHYEPLEETPTPQCKSDTYNWIFPITLIVLVSVAIILYFKRTRSKATIQTNNAVH